MNKETVKDFLKKIDKYNSEQPGYGSAGSTYLRSIITDIGRYNTMPMTNAEWCVYNGIQFNDVKWYDRDDGDYHILVFTYYGKKIGKYVTKKEDQRMFTTSFLDWLDKEHKPLLTDSDREYLSDVIRPFKDNVRSISVVGYELDIYWKSQNDEGDVKVPIKKGMFENLGTDTWSLEELGI